MGWDGMGWDAIAWDAIAWDGMQLHGMGCNCMGFDGMEVMEAMEAVVATVAMEAMDPFDYILDIGDATSYPHVVVSMFATIFCWAVILGQMYSCGMLGERRFLLVE